MRKTHNIWWQIQMRHSIYCGFSALPDSPIFTSKQIHLKMRVVPFSGHTYNPARAGL